MKKNTCGCGVCKERGCLCKPYALFFDTLGNKNRIHIINSLREGPKNVTQVIEETKLEQTCVSHCLKKLQQCGFVKSKKDGKYRIYSVDTKMLEPVMKLIDNHVKKHCIEV